MSDNTQTMSALKGAVLVLEQALDQGLPMPETAEANTIGLVELSFAHAEQIEAWAAWLDTEVITDAHAKSMYVRKTFYADVFDQRVRGYYMAINRERVA